MNYRLYLKKNQSAPRPSEHPPVMGGEVSKRLGGIKGCKYKTSSWHLNRFPDADNIGSTVYGCIGCVGCRGERGKHLLTVTEGGWHQGHQSNVLNKSCLLRQPTFVFFCFVFVFFAFTEASVSPSFNRCYASICVTIHACAPTATRSYPTTVCVLFLFLFLPSYFCFFGDNTSFLPSFPSFFVWR